MKTINLKTILMALVIIFFASSCIDYYKVSTKVNADGSLTRTIIAVGDSNSIFDGKLKIPTDSTLWNITGKWIHEVPDDTSSDKKWEFKATRTFANVEELNVFLSTESDTIEYIETETMFTRKFRWFYIYIHFAETYKKEMPFNYYDIDDYMTDAEYSYYWDDEFIYSREHDSLIHVKDLTEMPVLSHEDSLRSEEIEGEIFLKFSEWYALNVFEEYYSITVAELSKEFPEKSKTLQENKDSLLKKLDLDIFDIFDSDDNKGEPKEIIPKFIGMTEDSFKQINPEVFKELNSLVKRTEDLVLDNHTIKCMTELPGLLLNTNADSISNNSTYWNYNNSRNFAKDYTLFSESRIVNKWAFVVTGVMVLLLLIFIIRGFIRK